MRYSLNEGTFNKAVIASRPLLVASKPAALFQNDSVGPSQESSSPLISGMVKNKFWKGKIKSNFSNKGKFENKLMKEIGEEPESSREL